MIAMTDTQKARNTQEAKSSASPSALRATLRSHAYSLLSSLGRFARQPMNHLLTLCVLALALALPTLGHLSLKNLRQLSGALNQPGDISAFLQQTISPAQAAQKRDDLAQMAGVKSVVLKTPEQALAEFRELTRFTDALAVMEDNPLPHVLVISLDRDALKSDRAAQLVDELRANPDVEIVQFDQEWLLRLKSLMSLAERLVFVFGVLLAVTVLLVIGNTIRLEILSRSEEIQITRLIGASNAFVRRPFLYSGFWFGIFGAGLAISLVMLCVHLLKTPVAELAQSYGSALQLQSLDWMEMLTLLGMGLALGWFGALIASTSHLMQSESAE
jgi:cell division transport system permease protein